MPALNRRQQHIPPTRTATDPEGGTNYTITGTSQILSVPYALHAKSAESVTGGITETDPVFTAWDKV